MILKYLVFHEMLQIHICICVCVCVCVCVSRKTKTNVFLCVAYDQYLIYSEHFS